MANILVVDDLEQNLANIKRCLHAVGHQILIARSVDSAKALLQAASFDLLICGAHLSHGTIFELLNFVKHDEKFRTIPFTCFCSNSTGLAKSIDPLVRNVAKLLGADIYISQETFDAEQFQKELGALLHSSIVNSDTVD